MSGSSCKVQCAKVNQLYILLILSMLYLNLRYTCFTQIIFRLLLFLVCFAF